MKKRKAIILCVAMAAVLGVTGCRKALPEKEAEFTGSGAATIQEMVPEEDAELVFWTGNKEYGEAIAEGFEKKYGIKVTVSQEGMGTVDKIALSGPGGEGADVFMSPHDSFQKGLSAGVFLKLEDAIKKEVSETLSKTGVDTVMKDGDLYGIPVSVEVNCLYYNKDIVENPARTLEEIMEQAEGFNDPNQNKFILLTAIGDGYYEHAFVTAHGFQLFGEHGNDGDNPGFDTEEYEKGLELIAELHDTIPISSTDLSNKSALKNAFMEGKVAYFISGNWDVTQIKESGINFGITTLPTYQGKNLTPFAGVQCAHVSLYTDYPVAAQLLAAYLASEEGAGILYREYDGITTRKETSKVEGLGDDAYLTPFVEQFEHAVAMPSVSRISFYWSISQEIDKAVFDGKLTPAEGRKKAVENWNALLATE